MKRRDSIVALILFIKNGGLFGKGPGKGVQQHFVYAGESDFVYVLTIEQYGIIFGGLLPMFLYLFKG